MTAIGLEDAYAINNAGQVVGYVNRVAGAEVLSVAVAVMLRLAVALGSSREVVATIFRFIWREGRASHCT